MDLGGATADDADDATALLEAVRDHVGNGRVAFGAAPRSLGGSFSDVGSFRLSGIEGEWAAPLVVRWYRPDEGLDQALRERAIQDGAADVGFPAPRVLLSGGGDGDGRAFVVMERLPGTPVLRGTRWDLFTRSLPALLARWPARFAAVASRLHAVDTARVLERCAEYGVEPATVSAGRLLDDVTRRVAISDWDAMGVVDWLRTHEPAYDGAPALVHGDLWPGNVLMDHGALTGVVDWGTAGIGDPALDVGFVTAGLTVMPAPFPPPEPFASGVGAAGRWLGRRIAARWLLDHPGDADRIAWHQVLRCMFELSFVAATAATSDPQGRSLVERAPWANGAESLCALVEDLTGLRVESPA